MNTKNFTKKFSSALLFLLFIVSISCSSGAGPDNIQPEPNLSMLSAIEISPTNTLIPMEAERQFLATAIFTDGSKQDITEIVEWQSNKDIITISQDGIVRSSDTTGEIEIIATMGTMQGTVSTTVTNATLQSIEISPPNQTIPQGVKEKYTATGHYSDGVNDEIIMDITSSVNWTVTNTAIANFEDSQKDGYLTAKSTGTTTIKAERNGIFKETDITITNKELISIQITPATTSIPIGTELNFTAKGEYSDGSSLDLTDQVTWSSSATNIATIDSTGKSSTGEIAGSGKITGTTTISAELNSKKGIATLTVTDEELVSISISPNNSSTPLGLSELFTASGKYTNSTKDITSQVTWSSSDNNIITIDNSNNNTGKGTTISKGIVTITAIMPGNENLAGTTVFEVTEEELLSIEISPENSAIPLGSAINYTATGIFTNGNKVITESVVWTSGNESIAIISNQEGQRGTLTTLTEGVCSISAELNSISHSTNITVTAEQLLSISISPKNHLLLINTNIQMNAIGTYTNGDRDITTEVIWDSSDTDVASISNSEGTKGLATNSGSGIDSYTIIKAELNGVTGNTNMMVVNKTIVSISVEFQNNPSETIYTGFTQQFIAYATCEDNSVHNINSIATWSSADNSIATINSSGLATGTKNDSTGIVEISATVNEISGSNNLNVIGLTNINITKEPGAYDPGILWSEYSPALCDPDTFQYEAYAYWSDGTNMDITSIATWKSNGHTGIYNECDAWFDTENIGLLHTTNESTGWSDWVTTSVEFSIKSDNSRICVY